MNLYPAIDLYEGKVVRLVRGEFDNLTVYSTDPAEKAKEWENSGAVWIHVVDLEGAKTGVLKNLESLRQIRQAVKCRIEFGGGLRSLEQIQEVLAAGIDRIVLGTKALDGDFFEKALGKAGKKLAVGLDLRNGIVQTQGWLESGGAKLEDALKRFNDFPLETVIYTDIQKDGMLKGPDFKGLTTVLKLTKSRVILSGGVSSLNDIRRCAELRETNFEGTIIGKALYENKFSLRDALAVSAGKKP